MDENLTEEERKAAWDEFENEKKGFVVNFGEQQQDVISQINPQAIQVSLTLLHVFKLLLFKVTLERFDLLIYLNSYRDYLV